jgi:transcription factor Dp-1
MMVCKKVEEKGTTTYNEVADELVMQVMEEKQQQPQVATLDEKNIRRRVYDALNVLMAMDIITKDKKAITWKGLPTSARQDLDLLGRERDFRAAELQKKRQQLQDLIIQQVCFRNLTARNAQLGDVEPSQKIPLPFIIVNTHSSAVIQCNMSKDLTDVMFDFSMPFEINDDNTILKRLGMYGF